MSKNRFTPIKRDKKSAIIVDIDGTLANVDHRKHFAETKQWDKFSELCHLDTVNQWCLEIINKFKNDHAIILLTGRMFKTTTQTETLNWLQENKVHWNELHGRPNKVKIEDCVYKEDVYRTKIEPNYNVLFCIEDRKRVVEMWRGLGLTCLSCDAGEF